MSLGPESPDTATLENANAEVIISSRCAAGAGNALPRIVTDATEENQGE